MRMLATVSALLALSAGAADVKTTDYPTISAAIAACAEKGGGRVTVPKGTYVTGAVHLKSNVELHFEDGAKLVFTDDPKDYLPAVPVSWNGAEAMNYSPLVYAYGCTNVAITGKGLLAPRLGTWDKWRGGTPGRLEVARLQQLWCETGVPLAERDLTKIEGSCTRPHLIEFNRCGKVLLDGFSIKGSPFWTIHLLRSSDVEVRNLDVSAWGEDGIVLNNSDGIDFDQSQRVLVENCTFEQGDDAIVVKSGRYPDLALPTVTSEDITVRNCTVNKGHVLLGLGSEVNGGIRNVRVENCRVDGDVWRIFYVKTSPRRGGFVRDITMDGVQAKKVTGDVVAVNTRNYYGMPGEEVQGPSFTLTTISNLVVRNVSCDWAKRAVTLNGDPDYPIRDVTLEKVRIDTVFENFLKVENVDGMALDVKARKIHPDAHW